MFVSALLLTVMIAEGVSGDDGWRTLSCAEHDQVAQSIAIELQRSTACG